MIKNIQEYDKKYFIDTNIFLRTIIKEDEKTFDECFELIKKIESGKIKAKTSSLVISEIVWTMKSYYQLSKDNILDSVHAILALRNLEVVDSHKIQDALEFYKSYNIKFIDAMIASTSQIIDGKLQLISYDKDFDKIGVKRLEPKDV